MQGTEQQLRQRENNQMIALHAEVERCFRGDDVDGLRALVGMRWALRWVRRTGC